MARYIDVTTLQETLALIPMEDRTFRKAVETIDDAPTADVQPVIHARWETGYTFPDGAYWKCTHCKTLMKVKLPMDYCNACGAKMVKSQESGG